MNLTEASLEATLAELAGQPFGICPTRLMLSAVGVFRLQRLMPTHGVTVRRTHGARGRRLALKSRATRSAFPAYHFRSYGPGAQG